MQFEWSAMNVLGLIVSSAYELLPHSAGEGHTQISTDSRTRQSGPDQAPYHCYLDSDQLFFSFYPEIVPLTTDFHFITTSKALLQRSVWPFYDISLLVNSEGCTKMLHFLSNIWRSYYERDFSVLDESTSWITSLDCCGFRILTCWKFKERETNLLAWSCNDQVVTVILTHQVEIR